MADKVPLTDEMAELLRTTLKLDKFYQSLPTSELEQLFPSSGLYSYAKDDIVIHQGDESKDLFIISSGKVAILQDQDGSLKRLDTLGAGALLGEIAIVKEGKRIANAVTIEESRIYRLCFKDVELVVTNNEPLGNHLLNLAKERLAG